jgi:hypothetical protein
VEEVGVRIVRERILLVEPGVLRCQRRPQRVVVAGDDVERRGDPAAARRVRDAVADADRVRGAREDEVDVLTGREPDRLAAGRLGGQRVSGPVRADDRAVGARALGLLLDERHDGIEILAATASRVSLA